MKRRLHIYLFSLCFIGLLLAGTSVQAQWPSLSGTVVITSGGTLSQATVELLRANTDDVEHRGYTDSRGRFALRNVSQGDYELRIKFGTRVLTQVTDEGTTTQRRAVRLQNPPQQVEVRIQG